MIEVPLSQISSPALFAAALEQHRSALEVHMMGVPGRAAPIADPLIEALILRTPEQGPVADRGPDKFVIAPYTIIDDTPLPAETQQALAVLRETISG